MTKDNFQNLLLSQPNHYIKSHGLGNEYIVINKENIAFSLEPFIIQRICDVHFGIGSDGILLHNRIPSEFQDKVDFALRIFNPDGSEAEKSGNGLRIFCKYLYDYGYTQNLNNPKRFKIFTKGGIVSAEICETTTKGQTGEKAQVIAVDMGKASFLVEDILNKETQEKLGTNKSIINISKKDVFLKEENSIPPLELRDYPLEIYYDTQVSSATMSKDKGIKIKMNNASVGKPFEINAVSVGNPHFVNIKKNHRIIPNKTLLEDKEVIKQIKEYGKWITKLYNVNLQFVEIVTPPNQNTKPYANVLIYERGAGFTLASGSSACAVASVLKSKGLIENEVIIKMIGGELKIAINEDFEIRMTGEVRETSKGILSEELFF